MRSGFPNGSVTLLWRTLVGIEWLYERKRCRQLVLFSVSSTCG